MSKNMNPSPDPTLVEALELIANGKVSCISSNPSKNCHHIARNALATFRANSGGSGAGHWQCGCEMNGVRVTHTTGTYCGKCGDYAPGLYSGNRQSLGDLLNSATFKWDKRNGEPGRHGDGGDAPRSEMDAYYRARAQSIAELFLGMVERTHSLPPPPTPEPSAKSQDHKALDAEIAKIDFDDPLVKKAMKAEGITKAMLVDAPSAKVEKCPNPECKNGKVVHEDIPGGHFGCLKTTCPTCKGKGHVAKVEGEL